MKKHILETFPPGTSVSDPEGGFVLWIEVDESIDTLELYEILIKKDIIIAPGATFSASGKYSNFLRLNAGVWNEEIAETVTYIGETLFTMMGRR